MDRNTYNTQEPSFVEISRGKTPEPPEPEYVQNVSALQGIEVTGSKVNKKVAVRLSGDDNNALSFGSDMGLFCPSTRSDIVDGKGTQVVEVITRAKIWNLIKRIFGYGDVPKIAIDLLPPINDDLGGLKKSAQEGNIVEIDADGNLFVPAAAQGKTLIDGVNTEVVAGTEPNTIKVNANPPTDSIIGAVKKSSQANNAVEIDAQGNIYVYVPSASNNAILISNYIASTAISIDKVVALDLTTNNKVKLCDATINTSNTYHRIGISLATATSGSIVQIATGGEVTLSTNYFAVADIGKNVFASTTTIGAFTLSSPNTLGKYYVLIGVVSGINKIMLAGANAPAYLLQ